MAWLNYLVTAKKVKNTEGHVPAADLKAAIQKSDGEAYHCIFNVQAESLKKDQGKPTFKGYEGEVMPVFNMLHFDFDSEDVAESLKDVRGFLEYIDVPHYFTAFSGSKGFHVSIPANYFGVTTGTTLPKDLKALAALFKEHYPTIDTSIYSANNKHRALNSKHTKTGLYKTLIDPSGDMELIKSIASSRRTSFYTKYEVEPIQRLVDLYNRVKIEGEYNKDNSGTPDNPTEIEAYDGKKCIKKMLKTEPSVGDRNTTALIIINDFYKVGVEREKVTEIMRAWSTEYMPVDRQDEVDRIIADVYDGVRKYNHGCQDALKTANCSKTCKLFKKIQVSKRPVAPDLTPAEKDTLALQKEKAKRPTEQEIARKILSTMFNAKYSEEEVGYLDSLMIKQDTDLFYYKAGFWQILEVRELDALRRNISKIIGKTSTSSNIESALRTVSMYTPSKPRGVDLFTPDPKIANFRNGSLHIIEELSGGYRLDFREHNRYDYVTHKIDLDYDEDLSEVNADFEDMLLRIFEPDEDRLEKIACLSELFGAALLPVFPHLYFLYGVPQSGKSVICKILMNLIGSDNVSSVPPHEFNGFNMESMINKRVNLVTDIDTRAVISDAVVKQIEDRVPMLLRRKNKKDIKAAIPAIHIFGANDLPKTFDGNNKAHDRRWTILKFNKQYTGKMNRNIADLIYQKSPRGILNFALKGLQRLVDNGGIFSDSASGKLEKEDWQLENDIVGLFLKDIEEGEVVNTAGRKLYIDKESTILRSSLWDAFKTWLLDTNKASSRIGRNKFYKLMAAKGYVHIRKMDNIYIEGIGV